MTLTYLLIFILAAWRITSLLVHEDGPFFVFKRLREITGIAHDENGDVFEVPETFWAILFSCVWCCSIWVSLGWYLFWAFSPKVAVMFALPFAISGGTVFIEELRRS